MAEVDPAKQNSARPQLTMRSSSYLRELQQYRPPKQPETSFGIDTVVEDLQGARISPPKSFSPFNGIPSKEDPPKVVDSGLSHDFTHPNCCPPPGVKVERLIATLLYKSKSPRASNAIPSPRLHSPESSDIPANMAPTTRFEWFPLEPPAA